MYFEILSAILISMTDSVQPPYMIVHDEAALCLHRRPAALPPSTVSRTLVFVGVSGLNVTV